MPKINFQGKLSLLTVLGVVCLAFLVVFVQQQLQSSASPATPTPSIYGSLAPWVEVGGCQADAENSCIQTLAISQQGKIETVTEESGRTSLRLTNAKGKIYVFSDPDEPFISYEQAAFNNTKATEDLSEYYLISAANRGKDGSFTFNKIYEVWLGDTLSVKNIISIGADATTYAPPDFLKSAGNQLSYFVVNSDRIHLVVYNLSENLVEKDEATPEVLFKKNLPWYKNNSQGYYLVSVSSVPLGYVFSFSQNGELKGVVTKMVFWESKSERVTMLK